MALELQDTAVFDGSIANGASESLTVETGSAEHYELLVDDGAGASPASYDVTVEYYSTAAGAFMQAESVSASTAFQPPVDDEARGQQVRVTITNGSGASASYRVSLESFKEI